MKKQNKIVRTAQKTAQVSGLLLASAFTGLVIYMNLLKIQENGKKISKIIKS